MNDSGKITEIALEMYKHIIKQQNNAKDKEALEKQAIEFFLEKHPCTNPGAVAQTLDISTHVVTKHLKPNGFPQNWTKEVVENILNNIVWKNGKGAMFGDLKHHQGATNTPLWKAFTFYGFSAWYPLENYRKKFYRTIYPLFGIEMPQSQEEEREIEWPKEKILCKRYHSLMRLHHPDQYNQNYIRAKVATINCQLIADAYQKILKRKKRLTMGDPPSIRSGEMAIYSKRKIN